MVHNKMKIFIIPNRDKTKAISCGDQVIAHLEALGCQCFADLENNGCFASSKVEYCLFEQVAEQIDALIIIGGDGTIIHSSKRALEYDIPILGINVGRLGYLAQMEDGELERLDSLVRGEYELKSRMLLKAAYWEQGEEKFAYALNDLVLFKGDSAKIVDLEIYCNDQFVISYRADGIILSTPTGSTAYAMSAGGPIIDPSIDTIGLTPICPHAIFSRTILFAPNNRLTLTTRQINNSADVTLSVDGVIWARLAQDQVLTVTKGEKPLKFVHFPDKNFYQMIHKKFVGRG